MKEPRTVSKQWNKQTKVVINLLDSFLNMCPCQSQKLRGRVVVWVVGAVMLGNGSEGARRLFARCGAKKKLRGRQSLGIRQMLA